MLLLVRRLLVRKFWLRLYACEFLFLFLFFLHSSFRYSQWLLFSFSLCVFLYILLSTQSLGDWWLLFTHSRPFAQLFIFIERLLPSYSTVPAPFTQEECHELITLIRCYGVSTTHLFFLKMYLYETTDVTEMSMMTKESKHALFKFLGFSSALVSQMLLKKKHFVLNLN